VEGSGEIWYAYKESEHKPNESSPNEAKAG
jgi:hypothetical protein